VDLSRIALFDLPIDVLKISEILEIIKRHALQNQELTICGLNLHGIYCALRSPEMQGLLGSISTKVHIDGMPLIWLARLSGHKVRTHHRVTHIELIPAVLRFSETDRLKVAFVGSTPEGAASFENWIRNRFPALEILCHHGYLDMPDVSSANHLPQFLERMRQFRPQILLVGMGMPKQEAWVRANRSQLGIPVIVAVGGLADYFNGRSKLPPRWLGPLGLEGVYRLFNDPKRLAFRYLMEPILLVFLLLRRHARGYKK
jgi:N-acetylglucosaminyldiphosphoundecaprenol N-acetyl-beta-D-mannosaminyltransferase